MSFQLLTLRCSGASSLSSGLSPRKKAWKTPQAQATAAVRPSPWSTFFWKYTSKSFGERRHVSRAAWKPAIGAAVGLRRMCRYSSACPTPWIKLERWIDALE